MSTMVRAKLCVAGGGPPHASAGDLSSASQVNGFGMAIGLKAGTLQFENWRSLTGRTGRPATCQRNERNGQRRSKRDEFDKQRSAGERSIRGMGEKWHERAST
jgi:hypothetical protein